MVVWVWQWFGGFGFESGFVLFCLTGVVFWVRVVVWSLGLAVDGLVTVFFVWSKVWCCVAAEECFGCGGYFWVVIWKTFGGFRVQALRVS